MTVLDVGKYISMTDNNKSMGHDNINPFLLKLALPYMVEPLTYVYNLSILNNVFPTTLNKKGKVIHLPKTNDLSEPNNFRPISILPLLSKSIEKHIHKHLLNFLNEHNLLCQSQSGFCPQYPCHTALSKLCNKRDRYLSPVCVLIVISVVLTCYMMICLMANFLHDNTKALFSVIGIQPTGQALTKSSWANILIKTFYRTRTYFDYCSTSIFSVSPPPPSLSLSLCLYLSKYRVNRR